MQRVTSQPAWILHAHDYRDSSKIVRCLTRDHGRIDGVVKGAKRVRRGQPQVVQCFTPLLVSYVGRSQLMTMTALDVQPHTPVAAKHYLSACYVNELILQLLTHNDANAPIFDAYSNCLSALQTGAPADFALRAFEFELLHQLGYGLQLECDTQGHALRAGQWYDYQLERGAVPCDAATQGAIDGEALLALHNKQLTTVAQCQQLKPMLQTALRWHGSGRDSKVRQVWGEVTALTHSTPPTSKRVRAS